MFSDTIRAWSWCAPLAFCFLSIGNAVVSQNGLSAPTAQPVFDSVTKPAVVDIDQDGDDDFVVIANGQVQVLWNFGGAFFLGPILPAAPNPTEIRCDDLDSDGDVDILVVTPTTISAIVNMTTSVQRIDSPWPGGAQTSSARLVDIDSDGDLDVVMHPTTVLANDGTGSFSPSPIPVFPPQFTAGNAGSAYADFDSDGDVDRVDFIDSGGPGGSRGFFFSRRVGSDLVVASYQVNSLPYTYWTPPQVVDFDQDGDPDLLGLGSYPGVDVLFVRNDAGRFFMQAPASVLAATNTADIGFQAEMLPGVVDFDRDARQELIVRTIPIGTLSNQRTYYRVWRSTPGIQASQVGPTIAATLPSIHVGNFVGASATGPDLIAFANPGSSSTTINIYANAIPQTPPSRTITVIGPARQSIRGTTTGLSQPIVFEVKDNLGNPVVGATVTFTPDSSYSLTPGAAITDALGRVSTQVGAQVIGARGAVHVAASTASAARAFAIVDCLGINGWQSTAPDGTRYIDIEIVESTAGIPYILAADAVPLTPTSSVFGPLWTSIAMPLPTLFVLDGIGLFGPPNPAMVSAGNISVVTRLAPSGPLGVNLVVQAYAFDPTMTAPFGVIVTNPGFVSL